MNEIRINSYRIVDNGSKKPFCVYNVEARINCTTYEIEKRYSQFLSLHNELKNLCATPYFPPKKVRSLQQKVLEKRKLALESYLQIMLQFRQSRSHILSFLNIQKYDIEQDDAEEFKESIHRLDHHPIFQFKKNFIPSHHRKPNIVDVVVEGALVEWDRSHVTPFVNTLVVKLFIEIPMTKVKNAYLSSMESRLLIMQIRTGSYLLRTAASCFISFFIVKRTVIELSDSRLLFYNF